VTSAEGRLVADDRGLLDAGLLAQPGRDLGGRDLGRQRVDLRHLDLVELGGECVRGLARAAPGWTRAGRPTRPAAPAPEPPAGRWHGRRQ
jgi:hypothetical protein